MNKIAVARELVVIAKSLMAADVGKLVQNLDDLWQDMDSLDRRTMSKDEWMDWSTDLRKAFQGDLAEWVAELKPVWEQSDGDEQLFEDNSGVGVKELKETYGKLKKVMEKHNIYDRILHPDKYISRERDFRESNKAYLNVIPSWLTPIMIENGIVIEETLGGYRFQRGEEEWGSDGLSPEIEELVDLMNWAKSNKAKLGKGEA
jgi:hypothetical protein